METSKGKIEMKQNHRGINPASKPSGGRVCPNVWRHRMVGGFISAAVQSADTSDAVTALESTCIEACRGRRGISIIASFEPGEDGSSITEAGDDQGVELLPAAFASRESVNSWTSRQGFPSDWERS